MNNNLFVKEISDTVNYLKINKMAEVFCFKTFNPSIVYGPHNHKRIEIDFVRKGDCQMFFGEEVVSLKENEMIFIFSNAEHKFISGSRGCVLMQLEFLPDIFSVYEPLLNNNRFSEENSSKASTNYIKIVNSPEIVSSVENLLLELNNNYSFTNLMVALTYGRLLIQISRYLQEYLEDCCCPLFSKILSYIHQNYSNNITVNGIAERFSISERYIRKLFSVHLKKSPIIYINQIKIEKAKVLLTCSKKDYTIKEISYACGFSTPQQFSRTFKAIMKITPSQYVDNKMNR